jgi:hypothetical protein
MSLTRTDRRRFFLATTLTLLALPAVWWANEQRSSGAPNVAVLGADVDDDETAPTATAPPTTTGTVQPVFLDGPSGKAGAGLPEIAIPAAPEIDHVRATATFRSSVPGDFCIVPGVLNGRTVTIVNLDTNRSTTCVTIFEPGTPGEQIVLHTDRFSELADLTDAPIPVEIRQ